MKTDHYGQVMKNPDGSTTEETPLSGSERRLVRLSDVTDEILDLVENEVGMGCGAWDMVPPKEIIAAAWNFLPKSKVLPPAAKLTPMSEIEKLVPVGQPRLVRPLEVGCVVTTNGGKKHTIAEIGFGGSEGVAANCFYHWDKDWPYEIEHAAMDPDRDTIVSVSWPNAEVSHGDRERQPDTYSTHNKP